MLDSGQVGPAVPVGSVSIGVARIPVCVGVVSVVVAIGVGGSLDDLGLHRLDGLDHGVIGCVRVIAVSIGVIPTVGKPGVGLRVGCGVSFGLSRLHCRHQAIRVVEGVGPVGVGEGPGVGEGV